MLESTFVLIISFVLKKKNEKEKYGFHASHIYSIFEIIEKDQQKHGGIGSMNDLIDKNEGQSIN